jgi:hypothetical protein
VALAFDACTMDQHGSATSNTFSHTCSGSDRILYVFLNTRFSDLSTGVTYGGVAMTKLGFVNDPNSLTSATLYRLVDPASGANNVVASFSSARTGLSTAISFTGGDHTTPEGTPVTGSGGPSAGTHPSVTVSSAAGEIVVDGVSLLDDDGTSTLTVGAGQTERANQEDTPPTQCRAAVSTEPGAGSVTMSWTADTTDAWSQIAVAVKPKAASVTGSVVLPIAFSVVTQASGGATSGRNMTLLGVG